MTRHLKTQLLFFFTLFFGLASAFADVPVRVRIEKALEQIVIEGRSLQIQGVQQIQQVAFSQINRVEIARRKLNTNVVYEVKFYQGLTNTKTQLVSDPLLAVRGQEMMIHGKRFPEKLILAPNDLKIRRGALQSLKMDVIGVLPLENYLVGVLSKEIPVTWPVEAIKAQAVAARSYTLSTMRMREAMIFHVESTIDDQVFQYITKQKFAKSASLQRMANAIASTSGVALVSLKSVPVRAFYHSHCGGNTENPQEVWGGGLALGKAQDPYCQANKNAEWKLSLTSEELQRRLSLYQPKIKRTLASLDALPQGIGRHHFVPIQLATGEKLKMRADEFRKALGYDKLKSTRFSVTKQTVKQNETYHFQGRGSGHGVGLCQWGAKAQADQGRDYKTILKHYYPLASLKRIDSTIANRQGSVSF